AEYRPAVTSVIPVPEALAPPKTEPARPQSREMASEIAQKLEAAKRHDDQTNELIDVAKAKLANVGTVTVEIVGDVVVVRGPQEEVDRTLRAANLLGAVQQGKVQVQVLRGGGGGKYDLTLAGVSSLRIDMRADGGGQAITFTSL